MHGCDIVLTPWLLASVLDPTWVKVGIDPCMAPGGDVVCLPPVVLLIFPGVTRAPLNPQGGKGFDDAPQPDSDVVVAYDIFFRL